MNSALKCLQRSYQRAIFHRPLQKCFHSYSCCHLVAFRQNAGSKHLHTGFIFWARNSIILLYHQCCRHITQGFNWTVFCQMKWQLHSKIYELNQNVICFDESFELLMVSIMRSFLEITLNEQTCSKGVFWNYLQVLMYPASPLFILFYLIFYI